MSGNVFIRDQVLLDVSFDAAQCQLRRLASGGLLLAASEHAYAAGITGLAQQAGLAAAPARLAGVLRGDLMETGGCARLPLRWQAIGPASAQFPALDADLTLSPAGQATTVLALAGVYRLPRPVTARLGPATVRRLADVTIRSFIARLACALTQPAGTAIPAAPPGQKNTAVSLLKAIKVPKRPYASTRCTQSLLSRPRTAISPQGSNCLTAAGQAGSTNEVLRTAGSASSVTAARAESAG